MKAMLFVAVLMFLSCQSVTVPETAFITYKVFLISGQAQSWYYVGEDRNMHEVTGDQLPWQTTIQFNQGNHVGAGVMPCDDSVMAVQIYQNTELVVYGDATGNEPTVWYWTVE